MKIIKVLVTTIVVFAAAAVMLTGCGKIEDAITKATLSIPSEPQNVKAMPLNGAVYISWDADPDADPDAVSYNISYYANSNSINSSSKVNTTSNNYIQKGLDNGRTYSFVVTAVNSKGESESSQPVSATPTATAAPFISAKVLSYAPGATSFPLGQLTMVDVSTDSRGNIGIQGATVTVNGTNLLWNSDKKRYDGNVLVALGEAVTLNVKLADIDYSATSTQLSAFPTISSTNITWLRTDANTFSWTGGEPTNGTVYVVGVLDANGNIVYPVGARGPAEVATNITSYTVLANQLLAGSYKLFLAIGTQGISNGLGSGIPITGAATGSGLYLGAVAPVVPITMQ